MKINIAEKATALWARIAKESTEEELKFELEIHKKLLNFFQAGDYYYYIFNVKTSSFEYISSDVSKILGYEPEEVTVPFLLSNIHEDDQPFFLKFEAKVGEFFSKLSYHQNMNYKVRYDYRIRKKDGTFIRVLQQFVPIQFDKNNNILRTFGVHTDISYLKESGEPVLSFIGLNGEPSYINVNKKLILSDDQIKLTTREREILALIIKGKKSEEISKELFISKYTVNTHRKNILQKTNCLNTPTLITEAIKKGWV